MCFCFERELKMGTSSTYSLVDTSVALRSFEDPQTARFTGPQGPQFGVDCFFLLPPFLPALLRRPPFLPALLHRLKMVAEIEPGGGAAVFDDDFKVDMVPASQNFPSPTKWLQSTKRRRTWHFADRAVHVWVEVSKQSSCAAASHPKKA